VKAFTDSTAILEPFKGGKLRLFGGNIEGEFLQLVRHHYHSTLYHVTAQERNKKIIQRWRSKGWPEGVATGSCDVVTFLLLRSFLYSYYGDSRAR